MTNQINLFISYAHEDESYLKQLKKFINKDNSPNINIWDDGGILPGSAWDQSIKEQIEKSHIILFLISQDFLNSKYINTVELKMALDKHTKKTCRVIPIFTRNCVLDNYKEIKGLQGLPANKQFLATLGNDADNEYVLIHKKINELANELLTDKNISDSINSNDTQSGVAKQIDTLRKNKQIFLSIPDSPEGKAKRKDFLFSVLGKKQWEEWPYEIVPGVEDIKKLDTMDEPEKQEFITSLIKNSFCAIHILMTADELDEGFDQFQYLTAKNYQGSATYYKNILWLPNSQIISGLNESLLMNPAIMGSNFDQIFIMIEDTDKEKEAKIENMKPVFSATKKVYMFYDFDKDHNNDLRIKLKKEIEKKGNFLIQNLPSSPLEKDKQDLEKCDGACIFYGLSNPEWFVMRQSILNDAGFTHTKAVCIDNPDIDLKLDRDVSVWAYNFIIKGHGELSEKLEPFLNGL
ncbi:TIR domain-containing protein [Pedobacter sp. HMF7647]|uniref:TIR domain-containing protein n=1 Tax=Hufsiella arboris TaxID=2695275 RepID=A0A7K1YEY8_9SPHI|nr:toll/interleukin-1 receptor domain-containing protein [Hufsiella arboris]MXV53164.1 TIR domain-containing protein [Hufsiella arboris]